MNASALFDVEPSTWQELEQMTSQAFDEMGYESKPQHQLKTVRGSVVVDVFAVKHSTPIPTIIICECKYWNKAVDQGVVHAFRSVSADIGAHFGLIISKVGFQSGADDTRVATNIHLLNFLQFQETFFEEWRTGIFMRLAKLENTLLPILPGNPHYLRNHALQAKIQGLDIFQKYDVFFGEHRFTKYFVERETFPVTTTDPRGNPDVLERITIETPRQYYEISAQGCEDARSYFGI